MPSVEFVFDAWIVARQTTVVDTRILAPVEQLACQTATVHLFAPRLRRAEQRQTVAASGFDSTGNPYRYGRGLTRVGRTLAWHVDGSTLVALRSLLGDTVRGSRRLLEWRDDQRTTRQVRLAGAIRRRQTGPDRYLVEIPVIEEVR
jgi:hypothetical protein